MRIMFFNFTMYKNKTKTVQNFKQIHQYSMNQSISENGQ